MGSPVRLLGISFFAAACAACAPATPRRPPEHKIDRVFAEHDRPDSPGCAVGVIRNGAFVFRKGYGMASLELGVPNATDTVFYVGSVSKQLVAASVVLAARQGHFALDDDIRVHLPEIPDYDTPVTVRHLVHHTSGLRDYLALMDMAGMRYEDVHPDEELVALVARQRALHFVPGDEHLYSNSGYFLLAEIVERASGQSLREFAQENVFGPLGMTHTRFHDDRTEVVPHRATAYEADEDGGFRLLWYLNFDKVGSGGLLTTVEDLLLWDRAFYSDTLGGGGLVEQLLERGVLSDGTELDYAFGLRHGEHRGLKTVDHAGAFMGFRAQLLRFPDERVSVVALCNLASAEPDRLAREVADVVLDGRFTKARASATDRGEATEDVSPADGNLAEATDEVLRVYEGRYFSDELQATYTVVVSEGALTLQRGRLEPVALQPSLQDEFQADGLRLVFEGRGRGRPTGLTAHAGRVRDIRFERVGE